MIWAIATWASTGAKISPRRYRLAGPQRHAVYQQLLGLPGVHPGAGGAVDRALPAALRPGMGDFARSNQTGRPSTAWTSAKRRSPTCCASRATPRGPWEMAPGRSAAVFPHQAGLRLLLRLSAMGPLLSQPHPAGAGPSDRPLDLVLPKSLGGPDTAPLYDQRLQRPVLSQREGRRFPGLLDRRAATGRRSSSSSGTRSGRSSCTWPMRDSTCRYRRPKSISAAFPISPTKSSRGPTRRRSARSTTASGRSSPSCGKPAWKRTP